MSVQNEDPEAYRYLLDLSGVGSYEDFMKLISYDVQQKVEAILKRIADNENKSMTRCQFIEFGRLIFSQMPVLRDVARDLEKSTGVCFQKFRLLSCNAMVIGIFSDSILTLNTARCKLNQDDEKLNFGTHVLRRVEAAGMAVVMLGNLVFRVVSTIFASLAAAATLFKNQKVCDILSDAIHQSLFSVSSIALALIGIFSPKHEATLHDKFLNAVGSRTTEETISDQQKEQIQQIVNTL